MSAGGEDSDDLASDIFGVEAYEAVSPPITKEFLPWHKPRKQYVREEQWCAQVSKLLDDVAAGSFAEDTVTYCGLPGSDLLDIRCFHDAICVPRNIKLRFLGFNSEVASTGSEQVELNISRDEVAKLSLVDPASEVVPDDIRSISDTGSIAWAKVEKFGPFNVINLDLCGSVAAKAGGLFNDNYYNAISQLMAIQARQKNPWLFLLTTRVGGNHVHKDTLARLREKYSRNLKDCRPFKDESSSCFKIADETSLTAAMATAVGLHSVFLTGLGKWLLALALGHHMSVEVKSVLGYRILKDTETTDMVSLAFKFSPHPVPGKDPLKLAMTKIVLPNECALSVDLVKGVAAHVDVDALLAKDDKLLEHVTLRMAELLEAARYDVGKYIDWAAAT